MKRAAFGLIILFGLAPQALAQPPEPGRASIQRHQEIVHLTVREAGKGALDLSELGDLRGGEAIVIQHTSQNLNAVNTGNSVTGQTIGSGAMNINPNAFNGYDGIGNFVINTGHNNNLQGSISVSIVMTPQ